MGPGAAKYSRKVAVEGANIASGAAQLFTFANGMSVRKVRISLAAAFNGEACIKFNVASAADVSATDWDRIWFAFGAVEIEDTLIKNVAIFASGDSLPFSGAGKKLGIEAWA